MELLEPDLADTAADDVGDILLDLVLLELGVDLNLLVERDAELPDVPVCLVIGVPLLLGLLAFLFSFELEEDATAGADPPAPLLFPLSFTLSLLDGVVEPLTTGVKGTLNEVVEH